MSAARRILVLLTATALTGHLLAGDETPADRARELERDQNMVQSLIDSGLKLAAEKDPLRRAEQCNRLADKFAAEIKLSVQRKDVQRAAALGEQMQALLTGGVARNLTAARTSPQPDEPEIHRLAGAVSVTAKSIEDELGNHPELEPEEMRLTLQAVARGKADVELAVQDRKNKQ